MDRDGAIQEAADDLDPQTRGAFLKKAGIGVGALAVGGAFAGAIPTVARSATIPRSDFDTTSPTTSAPAAFEDGFSKAKVLAAVKATGFIVG